MWTVVVSYCFKDVVSYCLKFMFFSIRHSPHCWELLIVKHTPASTLTRKWSSISLSENWFFRWVHTLLSRLVLNLWAQEIPLTQHTSSWNDRCRFLCPALIFILKQQWTFIISSCYPSKMAAYILIWSCTKILFSTNALDCTHSSV